MNEEMKIPNLTIDFINELKTRYPDEIETDPSKVGTPEYWEKVGIIKLIQETEYLIKNSNK